MVEDRLRIFQKGRFKPIWLSTWRERYIAENQKHFNDSAALRVDTIFEVELFPTFFYFSKILRKFRNSFQNSPHPNRSLYDTVSAAPFLRGTRCLPDSDNGRIVLSVMRSLARRLCIEQVRSRPCDARTVSDVPYPQSACATDAT